MMGAPGGDACVPSRTSWPPINANFETWTSTPSGTRISQPPISE